MDFEKEIEELKEEVGVLRGMVEGLYDAKFEEEFNEYECEEYPYEERGLEVETEVAPLVSLG